MNNIVRIGCFLGISFMMSCSLLKPKVQETKVESIVNSKPQLKNKEIVEVKAINGSYVLNDTTNARITYKVSFFSGVDKATIEKNLAFVYAIKGSDGLKERLGSGKIEISKAAKQLEDNVYLVTFDIEKPDNFKKVALYLEIIDRANSRKYTNLLDVDFSGQRANTLYEIYTAGSEIPLFSNYIKVGQSFIVANGTKTEVPIYLKEISAEFQPALSPMSANKKEVNQVVSNQETQKISTNVPIIITEEGLYVISEDSLQYENGYAFRVVSEHFPRLTKAEDLVKPLVYMSTQKEIEALSATQNAKEALDTYFLNLSKGNETKAKSIIKNYYRRVSRANELFTDFQEGWKTDKGMVFTIMGPPSKVKKSQDKEVWVYAQTQQFSEIIYTFYKRPTVFTDNNYELIRYPEYSAYWFPYVESWRDGKNLE